MHLIKIILFLFILTTLGHASFLADSVKLSYSIKSLGRGGAGVAEPYGADSLTTNPAVVTTW